MKEGGKKEIMEVRNGENGKMDGMRDVKRKRDEHEFQPGKDGTNEEEREKH